MSIIEYLEQRIIDKLKTITGLTFAYSEIQIIHDDSLTLPVLALGQLHQNFEPNSSNEDYEALCYTVTASLPIILFFEVDETRTNINKGVDAVKSAVLFTFPEKPFIHGPLLEEISHDLSNFSERAFRTVTVQMRFQWVEGRGNPNGFQPDASLES